MITSNNSCILSPDIKVRDYLISEGYTIFPSEDDIDDIPVDVLYLKIIKPVDESLKRRWYQFWKDNPSPEIIGTLHFKDDSIGANDERWVLKIYGEYNQYEAIELAKKIVIKFEIKVKYILSHKKRIYDEIKYEFSG